MKDIKPPPVDFIVAERLRCQMMCDLMDKAFDVIGQKKDSGSTTSSKKDKIKKSFE